MHTAELLEQSLQAARALGYTIRHEWLDGTGGGACEFGGKKWLFVDLALNTAEQLEQVSEALDNDPAATDTILPMPVAHMLQRRKAACEHSHRNPKV